MGLSNLYLFSWLNSWIAKRLKKTLFFSCWLENSFYICNRLEKQAKFTEVLEGIFLEDVVSSSLTFLQIFRKLIGWDNTGLRFLDEFIENIEIDSVNKE